MWKHRGLLLSVAGVLILVVALLRLTRSRDEGGTLRFSADTTTSWELKGWRRLSNKKVDWEVNYRKTPFFYHEKIGKGELILTDEGCITVFPASAQSPKTFAISSTPRLRSPSLDTYLEWATAERDPATGLPQHFKWERDNIDIGELTAAYNKPLSDAALRLDLPPDAVQIDLARKIEVAPEPKEGTAAEGGITVAARAEQEPSGIVRVTLKYYLGGHAADSVTALKLHPYLPIGQKRQVEDNQQQTYSLLRPRARAFVPRADNGTLNTLLVHGKTDAQQPVDTALSNKLRSMASFFNSSQEPLGEPIEEVCYLTPTTEGRAKTTPTVLRFPVNVDVQFTHPLTTGVKLGIAANRKLNLEIPIQTNVSVIPAHYPPTPVLITEAQGRLAYQRSGTAKDAKPHFEKALKLRLAWNPTDPEQKRKNTEDMAWLRARIAGQEPARPTNATKR